VPVRRARFPREVDYAKGFLKDWERLSRSGRYDMHRLKEVMMLLVANDAPLGPEWKDHPLKGKWASYRECHVGGDFLLIIASMMLWAAMVASSLSAPAPIASCSGNEGNEKFFNNPRLTATRRGPLLRERLGANLAARPEGLPYRPSFCHLRANRQLKPSQCPRCAADAGARISVAGEQCSLIKSPPA
jgi:mRNA interferase YafQ